MLTHYLGIILARCIAIVFAFTIHEFVKASISTMQGDRLPKEKGALTLNPLKHIDPLGFIFALIFKYGWTKPTETNPAFYANSKKGTILTYTIPSIVNAIIGILSSFLALAIFMLNAQTGLNNGIVYWIYVLLNNIALFNVTTAVFNIVPVYPLDGYRVLGVCLKPSSRMKLASYESISQVILLLLLTFGLVGFILNPIVNLFLVN